MRYFFTVIILISTIGLLNQLFQQAYTSALNFGLMVVYNVIFFILWERLKQLWLFKQRTRETLKKQQDTLYELKQTMETMTKM